MIRIQFMYLFQVFILFLRKFYFQFEICSMLRSKIELGDITPHNIKQLKRLNTVVFPVSYNEKFYKDVLEAGELAKLGNAMFVSGVSSSFGPLNHLCYVFLAYYNDIVVGAVCCRIDLEVGRRLYIMTLGCLYPYRRLGIGTMMVQHVLNYVEKDGNFDSIYLYVLMVTVTVSMDHFVYIVSFIIDMFN